MHSGLHYGFQSIQSKDIISKESYLQELPEISKCLKYNSFLDELYEISKSIQRFPNLIKIFLNEICKILPSYTSEQQIEIIYLIGETLLVGSSLDSHQLFFSYAEEALKNANNINFEIKKYLSNQEHILENNNSIFTLWRLARLSNILENCSPINNSLCMAFMQNPISSKYLSIINPLYAYNYIFKALTFSEDWARVFAVEAIAKHKISLLDPIYSAMLQNEKSRVVVDSILKLPNKILTTDILEAFFEQPEFSNKALAIAINHPQSHNLLPKFQYMHISGFEINSIHSEAFMKLDPFPIELLAEIFSSSKEIIHDEIVDLLITLDKNMVFQYLIYPRMEKPENWRVKYNALKIFERYITSLENQALIKYSTFLVRMATQPVYQVRVLAFQIIAKLTPGLLQNIIILALLEGAKPAMFEPDKQIIRQLLETCKNVILLYCQPDRLELIKSYVH